MGLGHSLKSCSIDTATNISSDSHLSREENSSFSGQMEQNFREIKGTELTFSQELLTVVKIEKLLIQKY